MRMNKKEDSWSGEHYKENKPFQSHDWALDSIEKINFKGDEIILDIGCGDGKITAEISKKVPSGRVLGIDFSQNMIETAKKSYGHISNISFKVADATNFIAKEKFDLITSFFVFHWIEDLLIVLKNIKKNLKPDGKIIFIIAETQKDSPIDFAFESLEKEGVWKEAIKNCKKNYHPKSKEEIEILLEKAGFKKKEIKIIPRISGSPSMEITVKSLMRSIPHSSGLLHEKALEFCSDLAKEMYGKLNKKPDEPIEFKSSFLLVEDKFELIN